MDMNLADQAFLPFHTEFQCN